MQIQNGHGKAISDPEFKQHKEDENEHLEKLIARLQQLTDTEAFDLPFEKFIELNSIRTGMETRG